MYNEVKDSGKRQEFLTGSVRDTDEGKGMPHLIAGEVFVKVNEYINSSVFEKTPSDVEALDSKIEVLLFSYSQVVSNREQNKLAIFKAIHLTCLLIGEEEGKSGHTAALKRLAIHYQNGAKKYNKNNWRKGQYVSRYYDSAMRHLWAFQEKKKDEDHLAALLWNLVAIVQTKIDVERKIITKELDDYPTLISEIIDTGATGVHGPTIEDK